MPWKETCVIEERMKFVTAWKQGGWSMTDLCGEFGISRKTGYKILERYEADGVDGLKDRSRAPRRPQDSPGERIRVNLAPHLPLVSISPDLAESALNIFIREADAQSKPGSNLYVHVDTLHRGVRAFVSNHNHFPLSADSSGKDRARLPQSGGLFLLHYSLERQKGKMGIETGDDGSIAYWMWVPSAPRSAKRVRFERKPTKVPTATTSMPAQTTIASPFEVATVLVVDDSEDMRILLSTIFSRAGYRTIESATVGRALQIVARNRPQIVISDYRMPEQSGLDLVIELRKTADSAQTPVVILSAAGEPHIRNALYSAGADLFLNKPVSEPELLAAVGRLLASREQERRLVKAMEEARQVQMRLLPPIPTNIAGVELAGLYRPSMYAAGDTYVVRETSPGRLDLFVADVAGHGVGAALISATVQTLFETLSPLCSSPGELLGRLNKAMQGGVAGRYATAVFGRLDLQTRRLSLSGAGHPLPIILRGDELVPHRDMNGTLLGAFPGVQYPDTSLTLQSKDRVLFYSDGLGEAQADDERIFDSGALQSSLRATRHLTLPQSLEAILTAAREFQGSDTFDDDVTMIALEVP